jgi:hypothetical protein
MAKAKGSPKTGGRQKGTPNKVTADLQEAAQAYTPAALKTLNEICVGGESEAARVAAANSLLDRGHGRPTTHVAGDLTMRDTRKASELSDAELEQIILEGRATNGTAGRL